MKTLILMLFLSFIYTFSNAEQTQYFKDKDGRNFTFAVNKLGNGVERVYLDASKVVEKTYAIGEKLAPKIETLIDKASKQLKVTAEEVWDILVMQQTVFSIGILMGILLTGFSWLHFYYRIKQWKRNCRPDSDIGLLILCAALAISGTITSSIYFQDMLTGFINPKFGAIKMITEIATQLK